MNHKILSSLTSGLLLCGIGCSISYSSDGQREQSNSCRSNDDCGDSAVCKENACISTRVDLHGLIVEVRPNSSASFGASTSFLLTPDDRLTQGTAPGGIQIQFDSKLPTPIAIAGAKVKLGYAYTCALGADSSYPAKLTLERVTPYQGFHFDPIILTSTPAAASGGTSFVFQDEVSPGVYNVYIEPQPLSGCAAPPPPPIFYPGQDLTQQSPTWSIPKQISLAGNILTSSAGALDGWLIDLVEPDVGRVISTTQTLAQDSLSLTVDIAIDFIWPDKTISPYIRLRPPEGVIKPRPQVYWDLVAALIGSSPGKPEVHLTVADLLVEPRPVEIQIQNQAGHGVPAAVKVQSQEIFQTTGKVSTNATYGLEIPQTNAAGFWQASLPPGNYRVRVTPLVDDTLATTETDLEVSQGGGCFCGHVITVASRAALLGDISTLSGDPLLGAPIVIEPSQATSVSFWNSVHALDPLLPRATSALSGVDGGFQVNVDPGASDVSVRPSDASGFPWLVQPRVLVQVTDASVDLGSKRLPAPATLEGTFTDPAGKPVASAYIHAWLPVHDSTKMTGLTGTVIQIARATTDAQGHYKLVLPASISQ